MREREREVCISLYNLLPHIFPPFQSVRVSHSKYEYKIESVTERATSSSSTFIILCAVRVWYVTCSHCLSHSHSCIPCPLHNHTLDTHTHTHTHTHSQVHSYVCVCHIICIRMSYVYTYIPHHHPSSIIHHPMLSHSHSKPATQIHTYFVVVDSYIPFPFISVLLSSFLFDQQPRWCHVASGLPIDRYSRRRHR